MYCPDCGTENSRGQKFCTRCGSNLMAVDYARSIVNEVATGNSTANIESATVLKIVAAVSILGFLFTTMGTIFLSMIFSDRNEAPVGLFFGFAGFIAIVVIVKQLLRLVSDPKSKRTLPTLQLPNIVAAPPNSRTTNRTLSEGTQPPYYSVTEERTRQFENQ